jgi:hypothetical protein
MHKLLFFGKLLKQMVKVRDTQVIHLIYVQVLLEQIQIFLRTNTNPALPPGTCASGHGTALTNLQGTYYGGEDIRSSTPVPNANPPGDITTSSINVTNTTR